MYEPNFTIFSFMCVDKPFMDNLVETGIGIFFFLVLEIPKNAFTTLSQNLIGRSTLSQENCKLIGLY